MLRKRALLGLVTAAVLAGVLVTQFVSAGAGAGKAKSDKTATPIKHLVVIFQENVSFDHYFRDRIRTQRTRTVSRSPPRRGRSAINGLTPSLLTSNPNAAPPLRLDSSPTGSGGSYSGQVTCDQDHNYSDEQQAFDGGLMDQFVQSVGTDGGTHNPGGGSTSGGPLCDPKVVMDYYDGNTVTSLWNYAQHYAMSDNSFGTTFGPSAPGAINLVAGDTGGIDMAHVVNNPQIATAAVPGGFSDLVPDGTGGFSLIGDSQPYWDDCSTRDAVAFSGANIGDELNAAGLSWGWFQGGFRPTTSFATAAAAVHPGQPTSLFIPDEFSGNFTGKVVPTGASNQALCDAVHPVGVAFGETAATHQFGFKDDYIQHHEPFEYYASTANPHHLSVATDASGNDTTAGLAQIGTDTQSYVGGVPQFDTPNHNYDTSDFDQLVAAITAGQLPASALPGVTFLKAPGYQDGHAAYSEPADEQAFVTKEVNALMKSPDWSSTAVIVNYDDSDGWYDHAYSGVTNPSLSAADNLTNTTLGPISAAHPTSQQCGPKPQTSAPLGGQQGRCGFGPRVPMLVISPCAKQNYVDHNLTNQASIINFVEYNWGLAGISGSFDQALTGTDSREHVPFDLAGMFDFSHCNTPALTLDPATGQIDLRGTSEQGKNLKGADLSGAEAAGSSFQGSNLQDAFLPNADLHGSSFQGANLQGADLAGDNLSGANLQGANLQGSNLSGANLSGANLQGANLQGSNLTNANLTGAKLQGANTNKVTWSHTTCVDGTNSDTHGGTCAKNN